MTEPLLKLSGAACLMGGVRVLDRIDLAIALNERVAVVGVNGAGKSTLARLAAGLVRPAQGTATLFGTDLAAADQGTVRRVRRRLGLVLQGGSLLTDLSVEENLQLGLGRSPGEDENRLRAVVDRALVDFGLETAWGRSIDQLSAGERRRLELARAFIRDPDLLILDEPFEGADAAAAEDLEHRLDRLLRRRPRAVLLATHDAALAARLAPTVLSLSRGRLEGAAVTA